MPNYEYVCKNCGHSFEVTRSFSDSPLTTCRECGGPLRKVYGSIGIVFKGGGFYRTENRARRSATASASNGSSAEKATANSAKSSPDSKREAATTVPGTPASAAVTAKRAEKP